MLPIFMPRIHVQMFMKIGRMFFTLEKCLKLEGLCPNYQGVSEKLKEAEILRSSLIWCLVPMIQI